MTDKTYNPDEQQQNKTTRAASEPQACYAAEPAKRIIRLTPVSTRRELAIRDSALYPKRCRRWYDREELRYKHALEIMLDEYRKTELVAIALNCSVHMVYQAIHYHNIDYPRAYTTLKTKKVLRL